MEHTVLNLFAPDGYSHLTGDPGLFAWTIILVYVCAFILCWHAGALQKPKSNSKTAWFLLSAFCLILGFNKQLDLQVWVVWMGHKLSLTANGFQMSPVLVLVPFLIGGIICSMVIWRIREQWPHYMCLLIGLLLFFLFAAIRSCEALEFIPLLTMFWGFMDLSHTLEFLAALFICMGAIHEIRHQAELRAKIPDPRLN